MQRRRPVMLVVLDGWGWRDDVADNAIRQARTPTFDRLWAGCPHAFLHTSGQDVGLPSGQMGNSEVGHLNIGAGRLVMQDLPRINTAVARGEIDSAPALQGLIERLRRTGGTCHLAGTGVAGRRTFASGPRRRARRNPRAREPAYRRARLHRRPRHAAAFGAGRYRAPGEGAARRRSRSRRSAAATTPWTATSAGSAWPRPIAPSWRPKGRASPMPTR